MDRVVTYPGQIPLDTDVLSTNRNAMVGLGVALQALLGSSTCVDGLACTATSPASMAVLVGPGSVYSLQNVDATSYGSLPADTADNVVKQGIALAPQTLSTPAPATSGQSVVYLVQAAYLDSDGGPTVLPYYNASNPAAAYSGPSNSGVAQNTVRRGVCQVSVKTGVAATTGTQVAPAADAGYTGLYAVTVANGQTAVTSGNISLISTAPFITPKLTGVPARIQGGTDNYAQDTSGSANAVTVSLYPAPTSIGAGMPLRVRVANTNTGAVTVNANGLGAVAARTPSGAALTPGTLVAGGVYSFAHDGTYWVLQGAGQPKHGQCRLTKSGSNLLLSPFDGNQLRIAGVPQTVPSSGVTLAPTGLTVGTTYYVYAYMSAGSMALEASTTTHSTDANTGVEAKNGDASRTLVGMARVNTGPSWNSATNQRFVLSYFNRRGIEVKNNLASNTTTTSTTYTEVASALRTEFLCWSDEGVVASITGAANNNGTGACVSALSFNGGTPEDGFNYAAVGANLTCPVGVTVVRDSLGEGYNYANLFVKVSSGTGTWLGGAAGSTDATVVSVITRG